jgi:hypothetical protein
MGGGAMLKKNPRKFFNLVRSRIGLSFTRFYQKTHPEWV